MKLGGIYIFVNNNVFSETKKDVNVIMADYNLPTVGVFVALSEADDDNEEELSARAKGADGGGLELEVKGGLNGLG